MIVPIWKPNNCTVFQYESNLGRVKNNKIINGTKHIIIPFNKSQHFESLIYGGIIM